MRVVPSAELGRSRIPTFRVSAGGAVLAAVGHADMYGQRP